MRLSWFAGVIVAVAGAASAAQAAERAEHAFLQGDYTRAASLFVAEAESGRATAQTYLGYEYQYGLGVPKSYEEAARWYLCAAEQGEPRAQFFLGQLYDRGQGVPETPVEAEKWLDLAAAHAPPRERQHWETMRDEIGFKMSLDQLSEARRRAVAWVPSFVCRSRSEAEVLHLPTHKYGRREADRER